MKKYWIIILLIPFLALFSCLDDTSAYLPQDKEIVGVDSVKNEQGENEGEEEVLPEGQLIPGIHKVKLNITQPDGQMVERYFKYFMPISINTGKPVSLIFEFHGSYEFDAGVKPSDPVAGITTSHTLIQHAIKENCVICFPVGVAEYQTDGSGAVNWQYSEKHLPFVDAMIDYFKGRTPLIDINRIYSTGQSSGAIFSFVLAFERSNVFAAITPRAGQMSLKDQTEMPARAVPIRVFAGTIDKTVVHTAVIENMTAWAEKIGGYFATDMILTEDSIDIEDYKKVDTRIWSGGKADLQIYSLKEEGHGIAIGYCLPYMWEFMVSHTLDANPDNLFITASIKELNLQCNEPLKFTVNHTDGATMAIENRPKGWDFKMDGKNITVTSPKDYYGDIDRNGELMLTVSLNGNKQSLVIPYSLAVPKNYFEVGDIYYNEDFQPVGVVCWVDKSNIKKAKIISLKGPGKYESICYCGNGEGLGLTFDTPDRQNGYLNTQEMITYNKTLTTPFSADDAAFLWAGEYSTLSVSGWYLPAIEELSVFVSDLSKINKALEAVKGSVIKGDLYSSTTWVKTGAAKKSVYAYNFTNKSEIEKLATTAGQEYFGYITVRAIKTVTK